MGCSLAEGAARRTCDHINPLCVACPRAPLQGLLSTAAARAVLSRDVGVQRVAKPFSFAKICSISTARCTATLESACCQRPGAAWALRFPVVVSAPNGFRMTAWPNVVMSMARPGQKDTICVSRGRSLHMRSASTRVCLLLHHSVAPSKHAGQANLVPLPRPRPCTSGRAGGPL